MEVDEPAAAAPVGDAELTKLQSQLKKRPYDYELHSKHVEKAKASGDAESLSNARELFSQSYALPVDLWLDWIRDYVKLERNTDNVVSTLMLFQRAEVDILSIDICYEHALYAITSFYEARGWASPAGISASESEDDPTEADEELQLTWTEDFTRSQLQAACDRASQHLMLGYRVWALWFAFENDLLVRNPPSCVCICSVFHHVLSLLAQP